MLLKTIFAIAVAIVFLAAFLIRTRKKQTSDSAAGRLGRLIVQRADYQVFIGVPLAEPKEWTAATPMGKDSLDVQGFGIIRVADVRAFAVAYPNGQLVDSELCGLPWPKNLTGLWPASRAVSDELRLEELEPGHDYIRVSYGPSATRPRDRSYYTTTLKNISPERIRILRFAGYSRDAERWHLTTVTRQFYSAEEFREWYGLESTEWIEPGQDVSDPNNYGTPPVLWAYYCESASGRQFVAGGVLE